MEPLHSHEMTQQGRNWGGRRRGRRRSRGEAFLVMVFFFFSSSSSFLLTITIASDVVQGATEAEAPSSSSVMTASSLSSSSSSSSSSMVVRSSGEAMSRHAYATIFYMGTPKDYEYYVAARVLFRSLAIHFRSQPHPHPDLLLIASQDTPHTWSHAFVKDGVRVVQVKNIPNPYANRPGFNDRFMFTLNKLLAWTFVEYDRIVMLDADNLILQNSDELFQCGDFCAAFIDPCIFHTGLFVLKPSMTVFDDMVRGVNAMSENRDGADQGFLTAYFPDLLDKPMFHPPSDGSKLSGHYRLPVGYQMDASYYYLRLKWRVPCGPNSIVTFPGASLLKPWYWWSWPILPLGLAWHDMRASTIGYTEEALALYIQAALYATLLVAVVVMMRCMRPDKKFIMADVSIQKKMVWTSYGSSYVRMLKSKVMVPSCILVSFLMPSLMVPITTHPLIGWGLSLFGSLSLLMAMSYALDLHVVPLLTPWLLIFGSLFVMASPCYKNGILRAFAIVGYIGFSTPVLWWSLKVTMANKKALIKSEAIPLKIY